MLSVEVYIVQPANMELKMNKINAAVKLAIIVTMLMASSLLGCSHLNSQSDNSAEGDSDYDKIQEIRQDDEFNTILREYSAGQTSKAEVTAKLNELKERHTIKSYDWSSDGNTIICTLPGGMEHLISFTSPPDL